MGAFALGGAMGLAGGASRVVAEEELPWTPIGFTQLGEPLVVHHLGNARNRLFIMGGQHGWPEENTVRLARGLMAHFVEHPEQVPGGIGIDFMPLGNPDGYALGSRQYFSGVDPNRNWGGADWNSDAYDSNARFRVGLGGPEPFSEQETRAVRDWLLQARPTLMINYHSQGGFMFGGGDVADAYADASGYPRPQPRPPGSPVGGGSVLGYRASGTTNGWLRTVGVGSIFIELSNSVSAEFDRNLAGVLAALDALATSASA